MDSIKNRDMSLTSRLWGSFRELKERLGKLLSTYPLVAIAITIEAAGYVAKYRNLVLPSLLGLLDDPLSFVRPLASSECWDELQTSSWGYMQRKCDISCTLCFWVGGVCLTRGSELRENRKDWKLGVLVLWSRGEGSWAVRM